MKLMITGGNGFVGGNLVRYFAPVHSVTFADLPGATSAELTRIAEKADMDIRDPSEVAAVLCKTRPDAVIHAAGNKNVRHCEKSPEEAMQVNAEGTRNVARACKTAGAHMLYLSTDLIFDCDEGGYRESDKPHPATAYGRSKLEGERMAMSELGDLAICRSGGIYARDSPLLSWAAGELRENREIVCLTNVVNTPTYVEQLADMMAAVLARRLHGVFHMVGAEAVNRFQFFHAFALKFGFNTGLLRPVDSPELMHDLLLQPNAGLDSCFTNQTLGIRSLSLQEGMSRLKSGG